ncbi:putative photosynthetic complex assembly protein [Rhodovulum bhavnagarense]|uniref:Putative photosynthetic complex assembly protein n=1 Tax=Rhodovulum bhavnagarense TaxID=992286 RepID=A0A4V2SVW5_9RHOB|nr:photosynthetic complex assembly protein PuhC [Rhodovulum bhavnagarense]TCP59936.1 putative photosynthetic complex assembly protein [Rhodovulum bhavnagarense]
MAEKDADKRPRKVDEMVPPILVKAIFGIMLASLLMVAYARITDKPLAAMPDLDAPIAQEREIVIVGSMTGAATVYDTQGNVIHDYASDEGGFVAGIWRVLQRERGKYDVPMDLPVRLVRYESGRLSLFDDQTGWRAELVGFGTDNTAAFALLLEEEGQE